MSNTRPCVYIIASKRNGTLYVGVTSDLTRRVWQHRSDAGRIWGKTGKHVLYQSITGHDPGRT